MKVKSNRDIEYIRHRFIPLRNKLLIKDSKAESHFEDLLIKSGLYFRREKTNFRKGTRWCYYDFYLPYYNLYIEIDGRSHDTEEQKTIDREKEDAVKRRMKFITRLKNEEVLSMDSVNVDSLLQKCFEQSAAKRRKGGSLKSAHAYERVMKMKRDGAMRDMQNTANFIIDENKEVWLFDGVIGEYFRFENIYEAKFSIEMSVNEIHELCEAAEYKRNLNRRYVFAYTKGDCELRVMQSYGL